MHHNQQTYEWCNQHLHRYVLVQTSDQKVCDGIVEHVDREHIYLAVPTFGMRDGEYEGSVSDQRQYFGDYWYGSYPYSPYYPYFPRPRRFRRLILPLAALTALSLLPYY